MNKNEITNTLRSKYQPFIDYIKSLSDEDFDYRFQGKWSAGEQLGHIVKSVSPLVKAFSMPKAMIAERFGKTDRENWSYDEATSNYLQKLKEGGTAPERFLPQTITSADREALVEKLSGDVDQLILLIEQFEEEELASLQLPHPLLGDISLKEMLYNSIYHVQHHQSQIESNLKGR